MSEKVKEFRARTSISTSACKFTWEIENFSLCSLEGVEYLLSPKFIVDDSLITTWCLRLYPNKGECIAIYLSRISSDSSAHYVTANLSLIRVNKFKRCANVLDNCLYEGSSCDWGFDDVIDRKKLFGEDRFVLLPNDTLTVMCELKVSRVDDVTTSELTEESKAVESPNCNVFHVPKPLQRNLKCLYENKKYSDFIIKVGDEELKVHKLILCARSSVFDTMLNCDMKENLTNCLEITDFDLLVIEIMLRYIYYGHVMGLTSEISIQLYSAAEKYNLPDLKDICVKYLLRNLDIANICDVLTLGELHNEPQLKISAQNFICMNAAAIQETEKWLDLSKAMPDLVTSLYRLVISQTKQEVHKELK
ncbi:hypothetical protein JTE90_002128 [Oedothorax gibbosus]|uniref:Speckle-type POZ protein n=1 Tax=Oedothorax gibbosus TaxID=931172 RepID=A0AAV6V724_9ARAC|nr:hypothetical protein JTE90_002128 [Oedothorax gibbosus]